MELGISRAANECVEWRMWRPPAAPAPSILRQPPSPMLHPVAATVSCQWASCPPAQTALGGQSAPPAFIWGGQWSANLACCPNAALTSPLAYHAPGCSDPAHPHCRLPAQHTLHAILVQAARMVPLQYCLHVINAALPAWQASGHTWTEEAPCNQQQCALVCLTAARPTIRWLPCTCMGKPPFQTAPIQPQCHDPCRSAPVGQRAQRTADEVHIARPPAPLLSRSLHQPHHAVVLLPYRHASPAVPALGRVGVGGRAPRVIAPSWQRSMRHGLARRTCMQERRNACHECNTV